MTRTMHTLQDAKGLPHYNYARIIEEGRKAEFGTTSSSAKPFMRPAMEQTQNESLNAAKEYIAKRIPEEIIKAKQ